MIIISGALFFYKVIFNLFHFQSIRLKPMKRFFPNMELTLYVCSKHKLFHVYSLYLIQSSDLE